jgi:hypothetical protein
LINGRPILGSSYEKSSSGKSGKSGKSGISGTEIGGNETGGMTIGLIGHGPATGTPFTVTVDVETPLVVVVLQTVVTPFCVDEITLTDELDEPDDEDEADDEPDDEEDDDDDDMDIDDDFGLVDLRGVAACAWLTNPNTAIAPVTSATAASPRFGRPDGRGDLRNIKISFKLLSLAPASTLGQGARKLRRCAGGAQQTKRQ